MNTNVFVTGLPPQAVAVLRAAAAVCAADAVCAEAEQLALVARGGYATTVEWAVATGADIGTMTPVALLEIKALAARANVRAAESDLLATVRSAK